MTFNFIKGILSYSKKDLNLKACLRGGQSFRWFISKDDENEFTGVIRDKIFTLRQSEASIEYTVHYNQLITKHPGNIDEELKEYFHLNEDLGDLYRNWSQKDANFCKRIEQYGNVLNGIRVLRLDPVENLFSFICSSNNNIKRITQMVNNMCCHFGELIGTLNDTDYYMFPSIERLSQNDVEDKLRKLNFGYRAKFINQAAVYIKNNFDEQWLFSLRENSYTDTINELIKIPGIGKKVADCISLMSLDKLEAIPVDTHVLNLARNMYNFVPKEAKKSLSDKTYKQIADSFRQLWGKYAGWAQTVMFIDDLAEFKKEKNNQVEKSEKLTLKRSVSDSMDIEPGLLPIEELRRILENKGIKLGDSQSKQELIELYLKFVKPQPQRLRKSCKHEETKVVSLKLENISLSEAKERRQKRFKTNLDHDQEMETSPKKITLKRPNLNSSKKDGDIKKLKFDF
ncbi:N-glycosylase DNA lyase [Brachionus plicatilis]|uniref:N-glycosylase/DNA lyase n=1 Tax=Brachionus plicatilis TaxID=10195 RepID=A0A3M7PHT2_BRAPC|nr:N-glycosylase DNA lyase [Brachionus plicatilis]